VAPRDAPLLSVACSDWPRRSLCRAKGPTCTRDARSTRQVLSLCALGARAAMIGAAQKMVPRTDYPSRRQDHDTRIALARICISSVEPSAPQQRPGRGGTAADTGALRANSGRGCDEPRGGQVWNLNSVTAWLLAGRPGHQVDRATGRWARAGMGRRPHGGRSRIWYAPWLAAREAVSVPVRLIADGRRSPASTNIARGRINTIGGVQARGRCLVTRRRARVG
jgi:hypothetical protein